MITIRSAGSQQATILFGPGGTHSISGYTLSGYTYSSYNDPSIGIISPDYGCSLQDAYSYEVPFGFLAQGKRRWGKLGDHDVNHVSADGEVVFDWLAQSIVEPPSRFRSSRWYFGDHYLVGASYYTYGKMFRWGETATIAVNYPQPIGGTSNHGASIAASPYYWEHHIQSHGDYIYVASRLSMQSYIDFADGFRYTGTIGTPYCYYARIIQRYKDPNSNTWVYKYRTISSAVNNQVKTPDNVLHPWNNVAFDAVKWQSWCTTSTTGVAHDSHCHGTYDEFQNQRFEVEERISLLLLERFSHELVTNPSAKNTSDLVTDIIAQHKVMDTMMLVTVVQLASARLDSVPWRNLVNIVSTGTTAIRQGKSTVSSMISAIKRISKDGSGTYLGTIYGVLPTWSDIGIAWNAADVAAKLRLQPPRLHARTITNETPVLGSLSTQLVLTVDVDNIPKDFLSPPMRTIRDIWALGFWPTFEMAWDCVPFSFVANWFIQISAAVEDLDAHVWVKYFPIWHCISSEKRQWTVSLQDLWPDLDIPMSDVVLTSYHRWCENELPLPPIRLGDEPTGQFNHWAEATALVIQKIF